MNRRDFIAGAATSSLIALSGSLHASSQSADKKTAHKFKLKYAPHLGMFQNLAGSSEYDKQIKEFESKKDPSLADKLNNLKLNAYIDELKFAADQGFQAWEDNGMRSRPKEFQEKVAREMARLGIEMGVFVANDSGLDKPILTSGNSDMRETFLRNIRDSVEVAKRVNAKYATLVVGTVSHKLPPGYQMTNAIETLKRAAEICEPSGLILVAEPLNTYVDHPGFFITSNHQMYLLMKAVNSPSCKLLYDVYHSQINEGNLIPNIDKCWDEIAYVQTGDHPGRKEPGTGEINYTNVFRIVGMEHGKSGSGKEGERAVIDAYVKSDGF
jgi:hydroxypyruvate isomerase